MSFIFKLSKILNEGFYNHIALSRKEVPPEIMQWADSILDKKLQSHISLVQKGEITADMPWHEADREYYQLFKLLPDNHAKEVDFSFTRSGLEGSGSLTGQEIGGTTKIPSGFVMAQVGIYPPRLVIYTAEDATKFLPPTEKLTDDELRSLYYKSSLKSEYRPRLSNQEEIDINLLNKGLINRRGSVTAKGKNVLLSNKDRLDDIIKNF